jgi:hypothetical protein
VERDLIWKYVCQYDLPISDIYSSYQSDRLKGRLHIPCNDKVYEFEVPEMMYW